MLAFPIFLLVPTPLAHQQPHQQDIHAIYPMGRTSKMDFDVGFSLPCHPTKHSYNVDFFVGELNYPFGYNAGVIRAKFIPNFESRHLASPHP